MGVPLPSLHAAPWRLEQCLRSRRGGTLLAQARKQSKKSRKQGQELEPAESEASTSVPRIVLESLESNLPSAPSPSSRPSRLQESSPGEIYPVFAPQPGASAPWRWDDGGEEPPEKATTSEEADAPRWNPRTGFMKTSAELAAEAEVAASTATASSPASSSSASSTPSAAASASTSSSSGPGLAPAPSTAPPAASPRTAPTPVEVTFTAPSAPPSPTPLPAVSKNAVLGSALATAFWMTVIAIFIRQYAALNAATAMGTDPQAVAALLRWPEGFESPLDAGVAVAAAAAVTGARQALLAVWTDLRVATDRSNAQILTPLNPIDVLVVALASGIPEELLFRGALVPASFPDWRGVLLAAALFGVLHNTGGRNPAFAAWAGAVGAVYGAAYVATGNIWVPAAAHVAANAASAFIWRSARAEEQQGAKK
ncbi:hypothetical protein HYH03_000750 [Edaphochlamys debaryana]|uniref:CAAX prenyl protease 2/Lysostaphin resistance protein A-like domain-containing protein n=1 Tax=Edaphochlamys debaryana TaxID=47281 RepID=A0A836C6A3_9CHLO|nr:hypothetical protein HYH03_000750 [Edaphochlamys debaryana]|eukprot:KAG2500923.1 hypothetical protein HYH03_000750 [Edaphochlamys debaryana]